MKDNFQIAVKQVKGMEGGLTDDPDDSGGATNYGITEKVAARYDKHPKDLSWDDASAIYRDRYWDKLNLDEVHADGAKIARVVFNIAVNVGTTYACMRLQSALNALMEAKKPYETVQLKVDGGMGEQTLAVLNRAVGKGLTKYVVQAFLGICEQRYTKLVNERPKDKKYYKGWLNRTEELRHG